MSKFSLWLIYSTCKNAKKNRNKQNRCVSTAQQSVLPVACADEGSNAFFRRINSDCQKHLKSVILCRDAEREFRYS